MSENPGVPVLFGGHNRPPLVEIMLTDLFGAMAPPGTTGLPSISISKGASFLGVVLQQVPQFVIAVLTSFLIISFQGWKETKKAVLKTMEIK